MALKTLEGITNILGEPLHHVSVGQEKISLPKNTYIIHIENANSITLKIQDGPIKENGKNGCQIDHIIGTAKVILEGLNSNFPSEYNDEAIRGLTIALDSLAKRTSDRIKRSVEGMNKL